MNSATTVKALAVGMKKMARRMRMMEMVQGRGTVWKRRGTVMMRRRRTRAMKALATGRKRMAKTMRMMENFQGRATVMKSRAAVRKRMAHTMRMEKVQRHNYTTDCSLPQSK